MSIIHTRAFAKLNLTLDVLGLRHDGYHELRTVMQSVSLTDEIRLETGTGGPIQVRSNLACLPAGEDNLAAAAALRLCQAAGVDCGGLTIFIEKQIPVCAGLGGGSSDAAAVLRALNRLLDLRLPWARLAEIGQKVGSDVPYCVLGGTALAEGRGEILTPLNTIPHCWAVVCKPAFSISTPELFGRIDCGCIRSRPDTGGITAALKAGDLPGTARRICNVFEEVLPLRHRDAVAAIKAVLLERGALGAGMSGTGPAVFGLFDRKEDAEQAGLELHKTYEETYLAETIGAAGELDFY